MKLFRAVSQKEYDSFQKDQKFSFTKNTLRCKEFFQSMRSVLDYVSKSQVSDFNPPYKKIIEIELQNSIGYEMILDSASAWVIDEELLIELNECCKFVEAHDC